MADGAMGLVTAPDAGRRRRRGRAFGRRLRRGQMPNDAPPYPEQVIFIRLTGTNWLTDFSTLVSSGTVVWWAADQGVRGRVSRPAQLLTRETRCLRGSRDWSQG